MPDRPSEKADTVATVLLRKVALVDSTSPRLEAQKGSTSHKLSLKLVYAVESAAYSSCSQSVWEDQQLCLLARALGDKCVRVAQSQTGLEETDHLWLDTVPLLLPSKSNFLKC